MFRPVLNVRNDRNDENVKRRTVFALWHVKRCRHRRNERFDFGREVGRNSRRDDRLLYALVAECRRIDDASVPRDGLRELQTKFSNPKTPMRERRERRYHDTS